MKQYKIYYNRGRNFVYYEAISKQQAIEMFSYDTGRSLKDLKSDLTVELVLENNWKLCGTLDRKQVINSDFEDLGENFFEDFDEEY